MELKGAPTRTARLRPAPVPSPFARPVTPLMTDGGTKFGIHTDRELWHPEFIRLFDWLRDIQRRNADPDVDPDPDDVPNVRMPLPPLPRVSPRGLAALLEDHAGVDWRARGFSDHPVAIVRLGGSTIVLEFKDRAFVRIMKRTRPNGTRCWYVHVEAKHRELYGRGLREWERTWLGYFAWLTTGEWCEPEESHRIGWRTTQWHLNADLVGVQFVPEDAVDATSVRKRTLHGFIDDEDDGEDDGGFDDAEDERVVNEFGPAPRGWMQTFELGRKTGDVMVVGYKKGDEQREAKGIEPAASAYAVTWRNFGDWKPERDGDPFRVEIKARKKGLVYRADGSADVLYDFRDPAMLFDAVACQAFWQSVTSRRRIVERTRAKLRTCPTDARWLVVQSAAGYEPRVELRQMPHEVARLTRCERILKTRRKIWDSLQELGIIEHGVGIVDRSDFAAALRVLADSIDAGDLAVEGDGDGVLVHPYQPAKSVKRKVGHGEFFRDELVARVAPHQQELRARGGLGGISIDEVLGPPTGARNDQPRRINPWAIPSPEPPDGS